VGRLIGEARRRILTNELFAQGASASSAALAALILLLVVGSEILSWPVVVFVPLAALAIGAYRVRRRLPKPYGVAQIVDRRLNLADTLATAIYFTEVAPEAPVDAGVKRAQFAHAETVAQGLDARQAIPFVMPRSAYVMGALVLVASSLFALRYGLTRRLDLKQPLANFLPESLVPGKKTEQARNQRRNPKQFPQAPEEAGENADSDQRGQDQQNPDQQIQTDGQSESEAAPNANAKSPGKKQNEQPDSQMATDDQDQGNDNGGKNSEDNQDGQQGDSKSSQQQNQQPGNKQDANENTENSSLMDKMKDAFQNLMSKVKPQQQQQNGQQAQQDQKGQQGKSQQGSKQQNSKDGQQSAGQQGDAQEGENGDQAKNDESTQQQKGQGKSDSQQSSKQPGSGVGSQDGDKAIKNAEQLAAMGKLTELMGKRSQNITGEATVEVQSTNQQLRTGYVNKGVQHTQGGAEINRDEVPVALQPYVQQYFEQVRKQAGATPANTGPSPTAPASAPAPPAKK
jgi:hypothetical protein